MQKSCVTVDLILTTFCKTSLDTIVSVFPCDTLPTVLISSKDRRALIFYFHIATIVVNNYIAIK